MRKALSAWLGLFAVLSLDPLSATSGAPRVTQVEPLVLPDEPAVEAADPPPRLAESAELTPGLALPKASEGAADQLAALTAWNASGRRPERTGFVRPLTAPASLPPDAGAWGTRVYVADAYRLRLHLEDVRLPAGTRLWVWGLGEEPQPFGLELRSPDGGLWTPSVGGPHLFFEVELPAARSTGREAYGFEIRELAEVLRPEGAKTHCLVDGTCVTPATLDAIATYRKAVAYLEFIQGGFSFRCTGALLNDTDASTVIPYLLTANHCFSTQDAASTLEAFWDFATSSCNGAAPGLAGLPKSNGASLLATGEESDFTLVQLVAIPGGRSLLGWALAAVPPGAILHRLSHPAPDGLPLPQSYSQTVVTGGPPTCTGRPRPQYIYSTRSQGGTFGGSDGAPVIRPGGFVVGQLAGPCGPGVADGCDTATSEVDGAFATTYLSISQFLSPDPEGPCTPNATTLCIDEQPGDRRFRVQVTFETAESSGQGRAIPLSSLGVNSGGLFWFFGAANPEMMIKVLNGCGVNNRFWVFYSAGTNVGLKTTVTDTLTGASKTYNNPLNTAAPPVQDTNAFACP